MDSLNSNRKWRTKAGWLTAYALACGYIEKHEENGLDTTLSYDSTYHVKKYDNHYKTRIVWKGTPNLTEARKWYKQLIKQGRKGDKMSEGFGNTIMGWELFDLPLNKEGISDLKQLIEDISPFEFSDIYEYDGNPIPRFKEYDGKSYQDIVSDIVTDFLKITLLPIVKVDSYYVPGESHADGEVLNTVVVGWDVWSAMNMKVTKKEIENNFSSKLVKLPKMDVFSWVTYS